ncbi:hypothetical protein LPB136_09795 [Tenacibaculum todarodis]|uniref:Outer membrane protein beta-barrel domain-containing protein n=1 Tax=Tenacibaculum todarodis TaxID=1850252 RepID=A0A1L3JKJ0_9FLAO|nr:outer membrane beta-barrel family protein [Tenacibaculum todarodis]APG65637.1 hypothetical protein LPB136_09795 [Tenacibaculum todarodis]
MKTSKRVKALLIVLFFPVIIFAQSISGKVKDASENIPFADIIIKDALNKIITGTSTDDNGSFNIALKKGNYIVTVSFLGYKNWSKQVLIDTNNLNLGTIVLVENSENLEEVIVKSNKRIIERKVDRLVFNVEKSIVASAGNGIDILKIAPRVQVQNGVVAILGKGTSRVLINGRISPLEGEDLTNFLNGLSANDIKSIEIITNPPAKYDASGNGGLINIILKKGIQDSWRNSTTLVYNQNRYNFGTIRNNFYLNKNKISLSASVNATKGNFENAEGLQIKYPTNFWDINVDSKMSNDSFSGRVLLDYAVSENTTIGIQYLGNTSKPGGYTTTTSTILNNNDTLDRTLVNKGDNDVKNKNNSVNFHAITAIDSLGKSLSFDVDYFSFSSKNNRDFITEEFNNTGNSQGINSAAINLSNQEINNFSSKVDFDYPLKKVNLSFGLKASFTNTVSDVLFYNSISGSPVLDASRSNNFTYKEDNFAAYASGNTKLNDKLEMQFGLRLENTKTEGVNEEINQKNLNDYTKLFPTLYFSYAKNENNNFGISYGRRINRPNFRNLNPFRYYINDNSYSEGNPFLQPTFSDNFELSHSYKRKFNTSLSLNIITDGSGTVFTSDAVNQTQIVTRENYYKQYNYVFTESFSYSKMSWWQSQNSFNLLGFYTKFTKDFGTKPKNGVQLYLTSNNTFSLAENTKLQVNTSYSSKHNRGLFSVGEMFDLSFGLQHNFTKSNIKLSLLANDVLNTNSLNNYVSVVDGIEQIYRQNESSRNFRISLSYDFGNKKINVKDRNFGNNDERNRTN